MKKYLLLILFFISFSALGKISTENFESESNGSTSFTANGIVLNTWTTGKVIHIVSIAPTDISLSSTSINENVPGGSVVGNLSSIDSDAGSTFTYTLVSGTGSDDNAAFLIAGSNLQIIQSPDFETKSSYSIRIKTTSLGGLSFEKIFTITVNDLCEIINGVSQLDGVLTANQPGAAYQWIKCPATILVGENGQSYIPTEVGTYAVFITVGSCSTLSSCIPVNDLYSPDPRITSAKYNAVTGALVVTGKNLLSLPGANNDIISNKFRITGQGNSSYTLTNTQNVDITDANTFTLILSTTDKTAVSNILNKNGTNAVGGTVYNLMALEDWNAGAPAITNIADLTGNGITVSNLITPAANILYVNKSITGGNGSGDSWANAIPELADALKWANENKSNWTNASPLNIYVAKGTYKPMYTPEDGQNFSATPTNPRDKAFLMVNNVKLYGGFDPDNGIDDLTDSRLVLSPSGGAGGGSILSGDLNGNDGANFANNADNTYHVIISADAVGTAELNGFTVTGGNANGSISSITVNAINIIRYIGAGMYNASSSPTISNSTFSTNTASNNGGGMYNTSSSPTISNSSFSANTASNSGGGMYNSSSSPTISNSTFSLNTASINGGGMYNTSSSPTISNSSFNANTARNGGGMYNNIGNGVFTNVTFFNNGANGFYAFGYTFWRNSIIWDNINGTGYEAKNSLIKGKNPAGNGNIDDAQASIILTNIFTDADGADNVLGTADDDLTLKQGSPAINKGDNALFTGLTADTKDLAGNPRVYNYASGGVIDMGAYEFQGNQNQSQTINPITTINKTYGDAEFEPGGTSTSGLPLTYVSEDNSIAEVLLDGKINIKKAGTVNIKASQAGGVNNNNTYDAATPVVFSLNINKKPVTIALTSTPISKAYDGNTNATISVANLAFATGGVVSGDQLNIALSSTVASYATADAGTAKAVSVPLSNISLNGTSLVNYNLANTLDVTANVGEITKVAITGISFANASFPYDGTAKSLAITGTLPAGATVNYTGNGQTDAGTYTVTANISGGTNYQDQTLTAQLTIGKLAITGITFTDGAFTYDGTPKSLAITGTLPVGATVSYTGNGQTDAGTYTVMANISGGANYQDQTLTAQLIINRAQITGVSFAGGNFVYDGTAKSLAIAGTLPSGVTVTYTGNAQINAGTYPVTAKINGGTTYEDQTLTATLSIDKAVITGISLADANFSYDGKAKSLAISGTLPAGATVSYTGNNNSNAGAYTVTANINGGNNYQNQTLTASLTISKAPLTITANNASMCQGSGLPTFTASYAGFKNGESQSNLSTIPILSTTASSSSAAGSYAITAGGASSTNYEITYVNGTLTITALPTVSITSSNGNSISKGTTVTLTATGGTSYNWNGEGIIAGQGSAVLTIRPEKSGTYIVKVTNANGCSSEQSFALTVNEDFKGLIANNILTPNGDGKNDFFEVKNIDMYPNNELIIFDRGGNVLYKKRAYDNKWDGMLNGNPLAEGTYYYAIDFGNGNPKMKGFITLLRGR